MAAHDTPSLLTHPFPVARYRLIWEVESPMRLPVYAGSALRGVFGAALRKLSCLTGKPTCTGCPTLPSCPWPLIFESPPPPEGHPVQNFIRIPNPYVIEPPPWGMRDHAPGEPLTFHIVLVGRALGQLPLVVLAWQRALARGVGVGDGRARMVRVVQVLPDGSEQEILDRATMAILPHDTLVSPMPPAIFPERLTLLLTTPLRIHRQSRPLGPGRLTPRDFLVTLARRVSLLAAFHLDRELGIDFPELIARAERITAYGNLGWQEWKRWSNRQEQEMALGGITGRWTLQGDLAPFWPLLELGQWLHVGKNATFGLGHYHLHTPERDHERHQ